MANVIESKLYKGKVEVKYYPDSHRYYANGKIYPGASTIAGVKDKSIGLVSFALEEAAIELLEILASKKHIKEEDIIKAVYAYERKRDTAASVGTQIHDWIETYIRYKMKEGQMPEMPEHPNVAIGVSNYLEWESEHKVEYIWTEKTLYSKKHHFGGRGDFAAKVDKKLCLNDNKSGNGLYNSVLIQIAGYIIADEEESGVTYEGRWAIRPAKESEDEYYERCKLKNKIRQTLGKSPKEIIPYTPFEAKFLDPTGFEMIRDKKAFLSHLNIYNWDKETDFFKNK